VAQALRLKLSSNPPGTTLAKALALLLVALVLGPLLPGLYWALGPSLHPAVWLALWHDPQWPQALRATALSALLGPLLACAAAATFATLSYPGRAWLVMQRRLPLLLSMPHAAFAVGIFFLIAPSGWLARLISQLLSWSSPPNWITTQDPYALALAFALAIKESWFLLWTLAVVLGEQTVARQMVMARSLGYSRVQAWRLVLWPQVVPRMAWPLAAVFAYGLSVVDMAMILGPSTPPTFAVLTWQWLTDPDARLQAQGGAASLLLLALFALGAATASGLWHWLQALRRYPRGIRLPANPRPWRWDVPLVGMGYTVLAVLLLWSVADAWFFPALWPDNVSLMNWQQTNWTPFWTTLWLAAAASLLCLPVALVWLEWGPRRANAVLYLPLVIPAMPLVAAQYAALLHLRLDATAAALVWSHLLWVLPYMVLTLVGAYRAFDARLLVTARALGHSRLRACWQVKWPMLLRPLLAAWAVGFAVSVAQYLPTLFAGGGRYTTVTTEAVALSAGGNRSVLAVQALLQIALPLAAFALAALWPRWAHRHRLGLR